MSERDRALFAERLRFNGLPKKAAMIGKANGYFLDEVSALEAIAAARAEGDQAGYERGRRYLHAATDERDTNAAIIADEQSSILRERGEPMQWLPIIEAIVAARLVGRRVAIEECAAWLESEGMRFIARELRKALAEPTTQQDDNGESA